LDEGKVWTLEELRLAEFKIFGRLMCASMYCPDHEIRFWAALQLKDPYWDRQRTGGELSEEEFNQHRGLQ
jgi:hypothetical protein